MENCRNARLFLVHICQWCVPHIDRNAELSNYQRNPHGYWRGNKRVSSNSSAVSPYAPFVEQPSVQTKIERRKNPKRKQLWRKKEKKSVSIDHGYLHQPGSKVSQKNKLQDHNEISPHCNSPRVYIDCKKKNLWVWLLIMIGLRVSLTSQWHWLYRAHAFVGRWCTTLWSTFVRADTWILLACDHTLRPRGGSFFAGLKSWIGWWQSGVG